MTQTAAIPRKRAYDPAGTRARILDAAEAQFQARGYHATSMHGVMRVARIPGGSLYHHFPTKKALGLAVIEERVRAAIVQTWIEPLERAASAHEGVAAVFAEVAGDIERRGRGVLGCPLNNLALELALVDADFQAAFARIFTVWEAALAKRLAGEVRAPERLAALIVAAFSGAMAQAKSRQSVRPIRECAEELAGLMSLAE